MSPDLRAQDKLGQSLATGEAIQGQGAVHLQTELHAQSNRPEQHKGTRAGELGCDDIRQGDDGVPGPFELDAVFTYGALEGFVGSLAVGDPR